ncbi:MAG: TonB-dependent receptor [Rickettsiales bacterium]|nr:TonB-dependent receptor [Pseudomonadota bacterium]MDA0966186.1 TonB-dependent receptor [Pseudomonadota bacterium]MDG4543149.1 TonB-dependent receptor [Rickettsiales bacterium]MDG4545347.1 TonB-dependent receptor [Rickettsiales bacterium]MDG4547796.1 TonB-dependent receptor [Rickettsiales bacterium]
MKIKLLVASTFYITCFNWANANNLSPLEELLNTKVTTVSKVEERAFDAAAAIHVITKEDIKRSGLTSIPEILRLAPGVQVAQAGSGQWAISVRGFNGQFSNKLLVLIDGRSVYTPLFSGVYWDVQDTLIEDIKQIEIIRGPGATLWGANAVNGVINIITEEAVNTQKGYVNLITGNNEQIASTRYGGELSSNTKYRVYGKFSRHNETETLSGADSNDEWNMWRTGFRIDGNKSTNDLYTIQGDAYSGNENHNLVLPTLTSPFSTTVPDDEEVKGGNVLARWNRIFSNGSNTTIQSYIDYIDRNVHYFNQQRLTYDLDIQYNLKKLGGHQITVGAGYRLVSDDIDGTAFLNYTPTQRNDDLYSYFIQDKITLIDEKLALTVGSKFEHNNYTGFEHQPSARISYTPNLNHTLWASVSRAVRVANRNMEDVNFRAAGSGSGFVTFVGNKQADSEELVAYETGYRAKLHKNFSFDIVGFYNSYDNLASNEFLNALTVQAGNNNSGKTIGYEVSAKWSATKNIILAANYTNINMDIDSASASQVTSALNTPKHQVGISSHINLPKNIQFNNHLYYNHKIQNGAIPSYYRWDSNIKWKLKENFEITLAGQNLTDSKHQEFTAFTYSNQANIGRNVYVKLNYHF